MGGVGILSFTYYFIAPFIIQGNTYWIKIRGKYCTIQSQNNTSAWLPMHCGQHVSNCLLGPVDQTFPTRWGSQ